MAERKKIVALFPGQASQYVGMGKEIHDSSPTVRQLYEFASGLIGEDIAKISFSGSAGELTRTRFTQPAILTHSLAALAVMGNSFPQPKIVAGHSLGEYGALVAAGSLSAEDAITLVVRRAELMEVFAVEQHIHAALGVADRAYVLSHGELAMEGTAAELDERREVLEASYLGDRALDD